MTANDDDDLCNRWAEGEREAGVLLVTRHHAGIDRFFRFKLGDEQGRDLTQETFLAAQKGIGRKRRDSCCRAWLFGIARNKLLKHLRERVRDQKRFDPEVSTIEDLGPSPSTLMDAAQRHRLLLAALRRLPIDVQLMLELHYWEEMRITEIAEVVEKNVNTVRTQMARGRQRLYELMDKLAESAEELETTRSGIEGWAERVRKECEEESEEESEPEDA
jgi:RNA polymerase sigma factor (sigma-70 family)